MLVLGWQVKGLSHWLSILTCRPSILLVTSGFSSYLSDGKMPSMTSMDMTKGELLTFAEA